MVASASSYRNDASKGTDYRHCSGSHNRGNLVYNLSLHAGIVYNLSLHAGIVCSHRVQASCSPKLAHSNKKTALACCMRCAIIASSSCRRRLVRCHTHDTLLRYRTKYPYY